MIDSETIEKTDESEAATARDLLFARARKLPIVVDPKFRNLMANLSQPKTKARSIPLVKIP